MKPRYAMHFTLYFVLKKLSICNKFQETMHTHKTNKMKDQASESSIANFSDHEEAIENNITSTKKKNLLNNWPLMSSIILFCIVCFDDMAYTEVFINFMYHLSCYFKDT